MPPKLCPDMRLRPPPRVYLYLSTISPSSPILALHNPGNERTELSACSSGGNINRSPSRGFLQPFARRSVWPRPCFGEELGDSCFPQQQRSSACHVIVTPFVTAKDTLVGHTCQLCPFPEARSCSKPRTESRQPVTAYQGTGSLGVR